MLRLPAGHYLFRQGDAPDSAYLIEQGSVDIVLDGADGEKIIAVQGPGAIIGEMAIVNHAPRSASIRAREDTVFIPVTASQIQKRLATADPVLRMVLNVILERFRATLDEIGGRPEKASASTFGYDPSVLIAASAELKIERDFEYSLANGEVLLNYQPIVRLSTGRLAGFEALARWLHPERGMVAPSVFIPVAEAGGLSAALARSCMAQVANDIPKMMRMALANPANVEPLRVSINISGHDLADPTFVPQLGMIAAEAGLTDGMITLELTETALVHSMSAAAVSLQAAKDCGFKVAVDDFGTGYSSLNYLRAMPVDTLKIDRSFIQGMQDTSTSRPLVASMLHIGETLGLSVVAEGIEARDDVKVLLEMGCDLGQGYFFGRPRSLAETLYLIRDWSTRDAVATAPQGLSAGRSVA